MIRRLQPYPLLLLLLTYPMCPLNGNPAAETPIENPIETTPTLEEAVTRYYTGEFDTAKNILERRIELDPADAASRDELVLLYREEGDFTAARKVLEYPSVPGTSKTTAGKNQLELIRLALLSGKPVDEAGTEPEPSPEKPGSNETLIWRALWGYEERRLEPAAELLRAAVELQAYNPAAYFLSGIIALDEGRYEQAESELSTALKQEPNLTMAFLPLARAREKLGNTQGAYSLLLRARASRPGNAGIEQKLEALTMAHPELTRKAESEAVARRAAAVPPRMDRFPTGAEGLARIRVGLAEEIETLHLKTGGEFSLVTEGATIYRGLRGEELRLDLTGTEPAFLAVYQGETRLTPNLSSTLRLEYEEASATSALFDMAYGTGYYFAGYEDRYYRGALEFLPRSTGITVVNELSLEEYLYATVPSEIPAYWPAEALKAQAIAARSYTLANRGRYESRGFDLFASVRSASYRGAGNEAERTSEAIDATIGLVLLQDGNPLNAVYSANSGGYTENSLSVWGFESLLEAVPDPKSEVRDSPLPLRNLYRWITSRPDSYSSIPDFHSAAAYRWILWVPADQIAATLAGQDKGVGKIKRITSRGRGISGRIEKVLVEGSEGEVMIRGDSIRTVLGGLRSNLFFSEPKLGRDGLPDYFLFYGAGWGHGVGMDQSGAAGMAADGWTAEEILTHFYPRARVDTYYRQEDE